MMLQCICKLELHKYKIIYEIYKVLLNEYAAMQWIESTWCLIVFTSMHISVCVTEVKFSSYLQAWIIQASSIALSNSGMHMAFTDYL